MLKAPLIGVTAVTESEGDCTSALVTLSLPNGKEVVVIVDYYLADAKGTPATLCLRTMRDSSLLGTIEVEA